MKNFLKIGKKKIGDGFKPFIICELGINHYGSIKIAKKIISAMGATPSMENNSSRRN